MSANPVLAPQEIANDPKQLTAREQQVLVLVAEGCRTKEIATKLGIKFKTAACHRNHILMKFGVRNSVALLRCAIRKGLIQP